MNAYDYIKKAIIQGQFKPGQRLTEEFLANELNISRTPIREAIKQLEAEGLIVPLKRGVSVKRFTTNDIRQIFDLRTLLEGYAANQASIYRTEKDINNLSDANKMFYQTIKKNNINRIQNIEEIVFYNNKFHEIIIASCKNKYIELLMSKIIVLPLIYRSFFWYGEDEFLQSYNAHKDILQAIINNDTSRAETAMREHIYKGRDYVLYHLAEEDD